MVCHFEIPNRSAVVERRLTELPLESETATVDNGNSRVQRNGRFRGFPSEILCLRQNSCGVNRVLRPSGQKPTIPIWPALHFAEGMTPHLSVAKSSVAKSRDLVANFEDLYHNAIVVGSVKQ